MSKQVVSVFFFALMVLLNGRVHAQWVQSNGPDGSFVYALGIKDSLIFASTHMDGVFLSSNGGADWTPINTGLAGGVVKFLMRGASVFAATNNGVYRTTNNGSEWMDVSNGLADRYTTDLATIGDDIFLSTSSGVFVSTSEGASWTQAGLNDSSVAVLMAKDSLLFAAIPVLSGVFMTSDRGQTWSTFNSGLTHRDIRSLAVCGDMLFAATWGGGVFQSPANGAQWTPASNGLSNLTTTPLAISGTHIFVGTYGDGIFCAPCDSIQWVNINFGIGDYFVRALASSSANLFAGLYGAGRVWVRPLSELVTGIAAPGESHPVRFVLHQNYPNPFNPVTHIQFDLPEEAHVTLTVFDVLGQVVATLVNDLRIAGHHTLTFNANGLASGTYFYRLRTTSLTGVNLFYDMKALIFLK